MLKLTDVSMYYQNGVNVTVGVHRINLEFEKGEFVVIHGESGGGKTTLLNVISSLAPYHEGEMLFMGEPTSGYDDADWEEYRREHIGFVFQNYNLIDSYTVLQNVISAMLVKGIAFRIAKKRAIKYLEQVGLSNLAWRRASKLSSGQKQRLAIARALAKDTDIIIADEPTGNLDSENGRQIVEILASLAEEKLVIMVSHNIEEVEKYATRMIRLKDGNVVHDKVVRKISVKESDIEEKDIQNDKRKSKHSYETLRTASKLAAFNRRSQFIKASIVTTFIALVCMAAFIFLGSVLSNMDDTPTRKYDNSAFLNGDQNRIVVLRNDGSYIENLDMNFFKSIPHVVYVDNVDYVNDCNYYYRKGIDYKYHYDMGETNDDTGAVTGRESSIVLLENENFIRTSCDLEQSDLKDGRLPKKVSEIVLYSDDESMLGSNIVFYISDASAWAVNMYMQREVTVVGILKEETEQVYFHPDISNLFSLTEIPGGILFSSSIYSDYYNESLESLFDVVIADSSLDDSTVRIPSKYASLIAMDEDIKIKLLGQVFNMDTIATSLVTERHYETFANIKTVLFDESNINNVTSCIYVSPKLYERIVLQKSTVVSTQASIYIDDYAYVNDVIEAIVESGEYFAISPYRIGSLEYDKELVQERLVSLIISLVAFIAVFALEIIILYNILKLRRDDFAVLKSLGLRTAAMRYINRFELLFYNIIGIGLAAIVLGALWHIGIPLFEDITKYYRVQHILLIIGTSFIAQYLLGSWFNNYLVKQFRGKQITSVSAQ